MKKGNIKIHLSVYWCTCILKPHKLVNGMRREVKSLDSIRVWFSEAFSRFIGSFDYFYTFFSFIFIFLLSLFYLSHTLMRKKKFTTSGPTINHPHQDDLKKIINQTSWPRGFFIFLLFFFSYEFFINIDSFFVSAIYLLLIKSFWLK